MQYLLYVDDETMEVVNELMETTKHDSVGDLISTSLGLYRSLAELIQTKQEDERLGLYDGKLKTFLPVTIVSLEGFPSEDDEEPPPNPPENRNRLRLVK